MIKVSLSQDEYAECNMCANRKRLIPELTVFRIQSTHPNRNMVWSICSSCLDETVEGAQNLVGGPQ